MYSCFQLRLYTFSNQVLVNRKTKLVAMFVVDEDTSCGYPLTGFMQISTPSTDAANYSTGDVIEIIVLYTSYAEFDLL